MQLAQMVKNGYLVVVHNELFVLGLYAFFNMLLTELTNLKPIRVSYACGSALLCKRACSPRPVTSWALLVYNIVELTSYNT